MSKQSRELEKSSKKLLVIFLITLINIPMKKRKK